MLERMKKSSAVTMRDIELPWCTRSEIMSNDLGDLRTEGLARDFFFVSGNESKRYMNALTGLPFQASLLTCVFCKLLDSLLGVNRIGDERLIVGGCCCW